METVQWRPELNALTTPRSYRPRVVPKDTIGYKELAAAIAKKNPLWSASLVQAILEAMREEIVEQMIKGNKVSLKNAFTFHLTMTARLDAQDDPLPSDEDLIKVRCYAAKDLIEEVRQEVQLERLPPSERQPVIVSAEDTVLKLKYVLNAESVLRIIGTDLSFNQQTGNGECVLEGTRSGRTVQSRFAQIANSTIMVLPDIPGQASPWNNEYRLSISTRYTENGTPRTGVCPSLLRTPIPVILSNQTGILSGNHINPLVTITGGVLNGGDAWVRVQVLLDAQDGDLRFSLIDMNENGVVGEAVRVNNNGNYSLPGFAGSILTSLEVTVSDYAALKLMVLTNYVGRLVDVLYVQPGS